LDGFPTDKQEMLVIKMTEVVLNRMFVETANKLSSIDQELLGEMLDKQVSPEEIEHFLKENIHNYSDLLQNIIIEIKEELKNA